MGSGQYDRLIQFERAGTRDTGMQRVRDDWQDFGPPVPARFKPAVGSERFANAENSATAPGVFWFRYIPELVDLNPADRVFDQSTGYYYVLTSVNWDGRTNSEVEVTGTKRAA